MIGYKRVACATPIVELANPRANARALIACAREASVAQASLLLTPRMSLVGATLGDLRLQRGLLIAAREALCELMEGTAELPLAIVVGLPWEYLGVVRDCCVVVQRGKLLGIVPLDGTCPPGTIEHGGETIAVGDLCFTGAGLHFALGWEGKRPEEISAQAQLVLWPYAEPARVGEALEKKLAAKSAYWGLPVLFAGSGEGESVTDGVYRACVGSAHPDGETCMHKDTHYLYIDEIDSNMARRSAYPAQSAPTAAWAGAKDAPSLTHIPSETPYMPEEDRSAWCEELLSLQVAALAQRARFVGVQRLHIAISGGLDSTLALLVCARAVDRLVWSRKRIVAITMPGFGSTQRTKGNAERLMEWVRADARTIDIRAVCTQHFQDIGQPSDVFDTAFENAQARERTQILFDLANREKGLVVGTGNLSELALGWTTYSGDHMSNYSVNAGIPKTVVRALVQYEAERVGGAGAEVLQDILATPISPELLPAQDAMRTSQETESILGPYLLHDFALYRLLRYRDRPEKLLWLMHQTFHSKYSGEEIKQWLDLFLQRFFSQQFKRSCLPDGPDVLGLSLSPRTAWHMPSDALATAWREALQKMDIQE